MFELIETRIRTIRTVLSEFNKCEITFNLKTKRFFASVLFNQLLIKWWLYFNSRLLSFPFLLSLNSIFSIKIIENSNFVYIFLIEFEDLKHTIRYKTFNRKRWAAYEWDVKQKGKIEVFLHIFRGTKGPTQPTNICIKIKAKTFTHIKRKASLFVEFPVIKVIEMNKGPLPILFTFTAASLWADKQLVLDMCVRVIYLYLWALNVTCKFFGLIC